MSRTMFKSVSNKVAFPKMEEEILSFWEKDGTFKKSLKKNEGKERYKFYDGPPFATGLPHYGHLLAGTIKDIVPRYQTMRGKYVERRFGWDTHGLPIEALAQEALGVAGARGVAPALRARQAHGLIVYRAGLQIAQAPARAAHDHTRLCRHGLE